MKDSEKYPGVPADVFRRTRTAKQAVFDVIVAELGRQLHAEFELSADGNSATIGPVHTIDLVALAAAIDKAHGR